MNKMELLAPAGNFESLYAAINAGCDAVYLGLDDFNARIKAENFNTTNIYDVVRYAHLRDVKVYVTLNIIIKDDEYSSLLRMIKETIKANVDAYIIQDLGVASFLKSHFPNICLHASTQMGIHNVQGAQVAKELGFTRIVLSRETKLEDIKEIKEKTNLEIEYFIQGALCVSFSGNCYLSSFKTLNSGNRGRCQQLCRLKYQAFNGDTFINSGYLISPRDLSLIKNISLLKEAGVDSLKIEGRLRRKGYVATTVSTYRKVLDIFKNENINMNISYDEEILKYAPEIFNVTYKITTDRGITHELVRHKEMSFMQESTRYCNYSKNRYGNSINVIDPNFDNFEQSMEWADAMADAEAHYMEMLNYGASPQMARSVLPTSTKADIYVSGTLDMWIGDSFEINTPKLKTTENKGFLPLRNSKYAHPQIIPIAQMIEDDLYDNYATPIANIKNTKELCKKINSSQK